MVTRKSWVCRCDGGRPATKPADVWSPAARPGNCWPARRVIGPRCRQDLVGSGPRSTPWLHRIVGSGAWPGANAGGGRVTTRPSDLTSNVRLLGDLLTGSFNFRCVAWLTNSGTHRRDREHHEELVVAAGLFGAVGLLTAAPASAEEMDVACSPAILCYIGGVPGQAVENIAHGAGRAYENVVTAPGRAFDGHRHGAGDTCVSRTSPRRRNARTRTSRRRRVARSRTSPRRRNARSTTSARRSDLLRSGEQPHTGAQWCVIVVTRSLGYAALIRYALVGTALVHPSTRWA